MAINSQNNINLRLAKVSDIQQIARTNLATLPENYAPSFYNNHLRTWPNLALVVEAIPEDGGNGEVRARMLQGLERSDSSKSPITITARRVATSLRQ